MLIWEFPGGDREAYSLSNGWHHHHSDNDNDNQQHHHINNTSTTTNIVVIDIITSLSFVCRNYDLFIKQKNYLTYITSHITSHHYMSTYARAYISLAWSIHYWFILFANKQLNIRTLIFVLLVWKYLQYNNTVIDCSKKTGHIINHDRSSCHHHHHHHLFNYIIIQS